MAIRGTARHQQLHDSVSVCPSCGLDAGPELDEHLLVCASDELADNEPEMAALVDYFVRRLFPLRSHLR
jgi:hypothetical protein